MAISKTIGIKPIVLMEGLPAIESLAGPPKP